MGRGGLIVGGNSSDRGRCSGSSDGSSTVLGRGRGSNRVMVMVRVRRRVRFRQLRHCYVNAILRSMIRTYVAHSRSFQVSILQLQQPDNPRP